MGTHPPDVASHPPVYFFIPEDLWPDDMTPETGYFFSDERGGKWNWTFQTYECLLNAGFPCQLVGTLPEAGIIVAHTRLLDDGLIPNAQQLFVCIEADRGRHPFAQLHVQQNPAGSEVANRELRTRIDQRIMGLPVPNQYICYWPQPGLIPRDPERGDRFERIVYLGRAKNLAPELRSEAWRRSISDRGLTWEIIEDRTCWQDYRQVDAILAARDFTDEPHLHKPATKLQNAWRGGVPAVLGVESAFRAEHRSDLDYLEVDSAGEALAALVRLQSDAALRRAMIENGRERARDITVERITSSWERYLREVAAPAYRAWRASSELARRAFVLDRRVWRARDRLEARIRRKLEKRRAQTSEAPG